MSSWEILGDRIRRYDCSVKKGQQEVCQDD